MNSSQIIFSETPGKIFVDCKLLKQNDTYIQNLKCISSSIIGVVVGYLLPIFSIPCILINLFIAVSVVIKGRRAARQLIYISGICLSSATADIMFIWLWQYPAYGLPYTTNGTQFFTFLNVSPTACRFHRFVYSSSATFMCNMRVCASFDRCLAVFAPIRLRNFRHQYAWYVYGFVFLLSGLLMLPFVIQIDWRLSGTGIHCWVPNTSIQIQLYHTFLSNLGPIQTIMLIIIDLAFAFKFRQQFNKYKKDAINTKDRQLHRYLLLFVSAASYTLLAATQCTFLSLARLSSVGIIKFETGLAYNMSDILWYLNILREFLDFFIYQKCFQIFDSITSRVFGICRKQVKNVQSNTRSSASDMTLG
ncbi:unnamed protein product [Heterobilharzia americana]|nr:unnamed protein product [Heterobilharzia americana]